MKTGQVLRRFVGSSHFPTAEIASPSREASGASAIHISDEPANHRLLRRALLVSFVTAFLTTTVFAIPGDARLSSDTQVFTGRLTPASPKASFAVTAGGGTLHSHLQFTGASSLTLAIRDSGGAVVGKTSASSPLVLSKGVPAGTYTFTINSGRSTPPSGVDFTLSVSYPAGDNTAPTLVIATPANGSTLQAGTSIAGTASDNRVVAKVEAKIDGGAFSPAIGTTDWSYTWDTSEVADGSHTVTARATDTASNTVTNTIVVTVQNGSPSPVPPEIHPGTGNPINPDPTRQITVRPEASAPVGSPVQLWQNGCPSVDGFYYIDSPGYHIQFFFDYDGYGEWDTTGAPAGQYDIRAACDTREEFFTTYTLSA